MAFENIPYEVGDVVVVPGTTQGTGIVESISVHTTPKVSCCVMIGFSEGTSHREFVFSENDSLEAYFSKEEE